MTVFERLKAEIARVDQMAGTVRPTMTFCARVWQITIRICMALIEIER